MKFVLRNDNCSRHAGALLAALAMTIAGCSAGEDLALSDEPGAVDETAFEGGVEGDDQQGTADANGEAMELAASEGESALTSPRGEDEGAAASSSNGAEGEGPGVSEEAPAAGAQQETLHTSGRQLLDTCGNPLVVRGVEQILGEQLPQGNDWAGLLDEIAATGVNAVRILPVTDRLSVDDVDRLLDVVREHGMVAYVTPYGSDNMRWLEGEEVRQMLAKHEKYILIDAFGEPTFDDRERFVADATNAIRTVRSWGYRVPLTVTANQFGRDLPSLLELGAEIVAADPLNNVVLGWQAYWSDTGYYQSHYGMSLTEGVEAAARAPFPIQLGLDRVTDFPSSDTADFGALMSATEAHGIGWLWWDWYNPYGDENNLTEDGSAARLTPTGDTVINSHSASVKNTAELACNG